MIKDVLPRTYNISPNQCSTAAGAIKAKKSSRLAKWAKELREHEINFKPRTSIKA